MILQINIGWRDFTNIQAMTTAIDNPSMEMQTTKFFRDGQVLIQRGEKTYTLEGVVVE